MRVTWNYGKNRPISQFFCNSGTCKALWQKAQREALGFTREWLFGEYVTNGRTANGIAREIGRDPKRVWEWIRDYGIETRKRGYGDPSLHFPKGHQRNVGIKMSVAQKQKIRDARLRDGHVPYLKNGVHWLKATGRKPATWKGGISPERQAVYGSQEWKECVRAVWKRDDATCQRCKVDSRNVLRGIIKFHLHHIDSFMVVERRVDPSNIVLLCDACHRWVHGKGNKRRLFLGEGH